MLVNTLTTEKRFQIYQTLTPLQRQVLQEFVMYKLKSEFHTQRYLDNTDWGFYGYQINPYYRKKHEQEKLYCSCGRELKNQFLIVSKKTKQVVKLGILHFANHLGIPKEVALEIQRGVNKIDIFRDEILVNYERGQRFPIEDYNIVLQKGLVGFGENPTFEKRLKRFKDANFPLYHNDSARLARLRRTKAKVIPPVDTKPCVNQQKDESKLVEMRQEYLITSLKNNIENFESANVLSVKKTTAEENLRKVLWKYEKLFKLTVVKCESDDDTVKQLSERLRTRWTKSLDDLVTLTDTNVKSHEYIAKVAQTVETTLYWLEKDYQKLSHTKSPALQGNQTRNEDLVVKMVQKANNDNKANKKKKAVTENKDDKLTTNHSKSRKPTKTSKKPAAVKKKINQSPESNNLGALSNKAKKMSVTQISTKTTDVAKTEVVKTIPKKTESPLAKYQNKIYGDWRDTLKNFNFE